MKNNSMFIQENAFSWAELLANLNHLEKLYKEENLSNEKLNFVIGFIGYLEEKLENLELNLLNNGEGEAYQTIRDTAEKLKVEPSKEFLNHLNSKLKGIK